MTQPSPAREGRPSGRLASRAAQIVHGDRLSAALDADYPAADARLYFTTSPATRDAVHAQLERVWAARCDGLLEMLL